ncbi:MAG: RimK family alpha-L-glutamate ligase [Clostridia bacterium]|nr:RimK family alpha-L-glutamate ligase [Clostridia bacterium]
MKALIVINAYIKNKSQIMQAERIAEELKALGICAETRKNFNLAHIDGEGIRLGGDYDFCIYLDKDRVASRLLEGAGLRLFNTSQAIEICDDKMLTNAALASHKIRVPYSIYAPLCYNADAKPDKNFLRETGEKLGYPLVAKTNFGSLGSGVTLIKNFEELTAYESANLTTAHFYQKFTGKGGEDIRVIVVGGKYVCAMRRSNVNDFRSNIELGGRGERVQADRALIALCEKVAKILELDYCGIDVLEDEDGYCVCEVNSNAFFAAAERVCGVNVAKAYAEFVKITVGL